MIPQNRRFGFLAPAQCLAFMAAAMCCAPTLAQTPSDDSPSVTPYRPSVSTPAALSAPGWLEFEAGAQLSRGGGSERRDSLPVTLKLAFTPDWGLRIGGDAYVRQTDDSGQQIRGGGDGSIVIKRRFEINDASAFGLEAGTRQNGTDHNSQLLFAASYNVSKSLVLDAGVARSLRSGVSDGSVFAGLTMLVGKLF